MHTLGYRFKPWTEAKSIADGPSILEYVRETADASPASTSRIRFNHRVVSAAWSTPDARWTVEAERTDTGETVQLTCGFLFMCSGYYRYDEGYTPEFPGIERFGGQVVHPQHWPEDLDYAGKRVVVIGSGATAVTLVPAMAETAAHVTMLQRSPTYVVSLPGRRPDRQPRCAASCRAKAAYAIVRWKNVLLQMAGLPAQPPARPSSCKKLITQGRDQARCRRATTSTSTSSPATTRGTSACAWSPTATSSRRSPPAAPRSSPTGSRPSPRTGSSSSPGDELEADIDRHRHRPQPALPRRHRAQPSTARRSTSRRR